MPRTRLCDALGIELPILSAPMGPNLSDVDLVFAVSEAGGLGVLQAQLSPPRLFREKLRALMARTKRPFGVNFILTFPFEENLEICLEEGVGLISFFWGDAAPLVERCHQAGAKVMLQVGTVSAAEQAAEAGVDILVAQGCEAGGHVAGELSTMALLPQVVDRVAPLPVVAAGGIADARALVAVLSLGAEGAMLGTRFLATPEANVHAYYRSSLLVAEGADTVVTTLFGHDWPDAPHRVLRTAFVETWLGRQRDPEYQRQDQPVIGATHIAGQDVPITRFSSLPPCAWAFGEVESMNLLAGQAVGLIGDIKPAGVIVRELAEGADALIAGRLAGCLGRQLAVA